MALYTPAVLPYSQARAIDPHQPGEHPVILGETLRGSKGSKGVFSAIRYNWQPKDLTSKQIRTITKVEDASKPAYRLTVQSKEAKADKYIYDGHVANDQGSDGNTSFALVFNEKESTFMLEAVSTSLNFNLVSAPNQRTNEIQRHPQLLTVHGSEAHEREVTQPQHASDSDVDHDTSPSDDPYDYRNFLSQAEEHAERLAAVGGDRTPAPGHAISRSRVSSPVPGTSRFQGISNNTPRARPPPSSTQPQKRRKIDELHKTKTSTPRSHPSKPQAHHQTVHKKTTSSSSTNPLSKEHISDSDDEMSDTITVARSPPSTNNTHRRRKYSRIPSSSTPVDNSPHIVVDDLSGLEIDMGSPPPESSVNRNRHFHVNHEAFRSHTGTPRLNPSPLVRSHAHHHDRAVKKPAEESDVTMEDADVEELALGSPRAENRNSVVSVSGRIQRQEEEEEEDDDDELAAELEAALEEEDEEGDADGGGGVGLGISNTGAPVQHGQQDEESEISEEE